MHGHGSIFGLRLGAGKIGRRSRDFDEVCTDKPGRAGITCVTREDGSGRFGPDRDAAVRREAAAPMAGWRFRPGTRMEI